MAINIPENNNFLSPLNFKFQLQRAPTVNFFIQSVNLPGFTLPDIDAQNPLIRIPIADDHLMYDELNISFKVDEDLQNYLEIHNWLRGLGKPTFKEYADIANQAIYGGKSLKSDITLEILSSAKRANYRVTFKDAFPISLGSILFNTTDEDVNYLQVDAKFRYTIYDIAKTI